ncbi:MAG: integrating conjugative element protein [Gilliamella apicola]|nr:integrating conjugative element protein [Gilliamella apicola]
MKLFSQAINIFILAILSMININTTNANLNVISDYGGNSMKEFYEMLNPQDEDSAERYQYLMQDKTVNFDNSWNLPVHSQLLSPAYFESYEIDYPTLLPFIIIGYDTLSIEWLKKRNEDLYTIEGLVGVVVNVNTAEELSELKSITSIPLYAISGDELAVRFQIINYPALITSKSVEQ